MLNKILYFYIGACLLIYAIAFSIHYAYAHDSWINQNGLRDPQSKEWCCNDQDCERLDKNAVKELPNGNFYIVPSNEVWPEKRVLWQSADGAWWRCAPIYNDDKGKVSKPKTRCLIGPPRGT
jgi:hypothetical protein